MKTELDPKSMVNFSVPNFSVILVAGGKGTRMMSETPKQYLSINNIPVIRYSLNVFLEIEELSEIVIVAVEEYRHLFSDLNGHAKIHFAMPGMRRQDSVFNGLKALKREASLVCIHDSARPCISTGLVRRVVLAGGLYGAATAAMPLKFTIKSGAPNLFVNQTLDRSHLWEIQTPQVIKKDLLEKGFAEVEAKKLQVTDDVSLVEQLGHPVKLVAGSHQNIKITTPDDFSVCTTLLQNIYG